MKNTITFGTLTLGDDLVIKGNKAGGTGAGAGVFISNNQATLNVRGNVKIYDNTDIPFRIFKKRKTECFFWENEDWSKEEIEQLTGVALEKEL